MMHQKGFFNELNGTSSFYLKRLNPSLHPTLIGVSIVVLCVDVRTFQLEPLDLSTLRSVVGCSLLSVGGLALCAMLSFVYVPVGIQCFVTFLVVIYLLFL